jgi:outer membrane protein TolC
MFVLPSGKVITPFSGRKAAVYFILAGLLLGPGASAGQLSLGQAESLALENDPSVHSVEADRMALQEMAVAAGELPDPLLQTGLVSLPTDSFELGQEPMTQVQVGVMQRFPRGQTRALRAEQIRQRAQGLDEVARERQLQILMAVREQFLEVALQRKLAALTEEAENIFSDLAEITQDYYASGRAQQHDVLQAAVELSKIEERSARFNQDEDAARSRLAAYIAEAAYNDFADDWPAMGPVLPEQAIIGSLPAHPRLKALQQQVLASETGVELADQRYKPEFALDLRYGGRSGSNPDGSSRSDLLSLMLTMDLPIFHAKRQDRVAAARLAESSAVKYNRDDVYRRMLSEIDLHSARLERQHERLELFENTLLPQAGFSAEASFEAYRSSVEDLTTLMRARITEYELQLEHARLQAEELKTRARLLYYQGDLS